MSVVRIRGNIVRKLHWTDTVARRIAALRAMETNQPADAAARQLWRKSYARLRSSAARAFAGSNGYLWSVQPFSLSVLAPDMPRLHPSVHIDYLYRESTPAAVVLHSQFEVPLDRLNACVDQIPELAPEGLVSLCAPTGATPMTAYVLLAVLLLGALDARRRKHHDRR